MIWLVIVPVAVFLVLIVALGGAAASGSGASTAALIVGVAFVACFGCMIYAMLRLRRLKRLTRIKMANWLAPGATSVQPAPSPGYPATGGEPLAVRYQPGRVCGKLAGSAAIACLIGCMLFLAAGWQGPVRDFEIIALAVLGCLYLLVIGSQAWLLARWAVPGRPVVDVDHDGVHFHAISVHVPWPAVSEIGLFSVRPGRKRPVSVVGFTCADPAVILGATRPSWLRRGAMKRSTRIYGTPFTLSDTMTDQAAERVATAASGFAGVPVSRH